jgi:hypothetical protein
VEVSLVIGMDDLMNTIQWSNHNISTNDIPLWIDCPVHNSGFKGCNIFFCPLMNLALWTAPRHDFVKITNKVCQKYEALVSSQKQSGIITAIKWIFSKITNSK